MGYVSRRGRRPNEYASKSAHSHVINDPTVQKFLEQCHLPKPAEEVTLSNHLQLDYQRIPNDPVCHVIAVDGGYNEVPVRTEFPSATICFFQFGALIFSVDDLEQLDETPFIDPDDISKLKQIQRLKFTLPVRNVGLKDETTLTNSVRRSVYDFFRRKLDGVKLIDTLCWFVFQEYGSAPPEWNLASCPACEERNVSLYRTSMTNNYTFTCKACGGLIYLTDVFRLHEAVDDELGAGGILGYVTTAFEQMIIVHLIRLILRIKPALLEEILFVKDGPLAFFGQTANMHKPMRNLVRFLFKHHSLFLAGLEKSGPFVEHADEISRTLENGSLLILDNDYIYKYILPGKADPSNPYGRTTYYSNKLVFKSQSGGMHVISLPTLEVNAYPSRTDFRNLDIILTNIERLRCDMYDSALIPVALANKLVSLANHPSSRILQRFAKGTLSEVTRP